MAKNVWLYDTVQIDRDLVMGYEDDPRWEIGYGTRHLNDELAAEPVPAERKQWLYALRGWQGDVVDTDEGAAHVKIWAEDATGDLSLVEASIRETLEKYGSVVVIVPVSALTVLAGKGVNDRG